MMLVLRHVQMRFHKIREWITLGDISLLKVSTENNQADILTKVLPVEKFKCCLDLPHAVCC